SFRGLLQFFPRLPQFRRTIAIAECWCVEKFAFDGMEDVGEGDLRWRFRQEVPAGFAAHASSYALRLQFNQDLDEIVCGHTLLGCQLFHPQGHALRVMPGQSQYCAGCVIALNRELHDTSLDGVAPSRNGDVGPRRLLEESTEPSIVISRTRRIESECMV